MRSLFTIFLVSISLSLCAQSVGDTIIIPTYNYTQTHGWPWCGFSRDTIIDFPDNPEISYEKIIMAYNMRCKDGLVSVPGNTNLGCGEWDYSCNTYIHDSSRVDSVISFTSSHVISNFSGDEFLYVENPMNNYYQHFQQNVQLNNINSETQSTVGIGTESLTEVISTFEFSGKSQYLFSQSELLASGVEAGNIDGILLNVLSGNNNADFFKLKIKNTSLVELNTTSPELTGFEEVYFDNTLLTPGETRIQFYNPFVWDGTSNILLEFSFTNNETGSSIDIEGSTTSNQYGMFTYGDKYAQFNGFNYIEANEYKGISGSTDRTCEAWVKTEVANKEIVSWGKNSAGQKWVFRINDDGTLRVEVNGGNIYGTTSLTDNQWHHVACVFSGDNVDDVLLYVDGELETIAGGADEPVNTNTENGINLRVSRGVNDRYFTGIIDEVRVWEAALSQDQIQQWMYKSINSSHPQYSELAVYYAMNENTGNTISDASGNEYDATFINGTIRGNLNGEDLFKGLNLSNDRPNTTFLQGDYNLTITEEIVLENIQQIPNTVIEYEILYNYGTMLSDEISEIMNTLYWQEGYEYFFDNDGILFDSIEVEANGSIEISELTYYKRYPSKYEIMSFVTPYGIYLDLGMEGKTWYFDVTDYAPILQGSKRMTIERGGEWQEDMDIKFFYIVGTPPKDILDIKQIWRADSRSYTDIQNERAFETRDIQMLPEGESYKLLTVITGHGQEGEFIPRQHTMNIDGGDIEIEQTVWTECSTIPIYPQGGTWVYDRAGWCPGDPSDIHHYDITEFVTPGQTHSFDYNVTYGSGTSNYIVRNHLVTYGPPNFTLDASIVKILKPNKDDASQERFNPACTYPEIIIQNNGSTTLTSLDIEYSVAGGEIENYTWTGSLDFLEQETVILPIPELTFWLGTADNFTVLISNPNGQEDTYTFNNSSSSSFDEVHVYPENEIITVQLKTNNVGYQTSYTLFDGEGNIYYERDDCDNNTIYNDEFFLFPGCYKLRIDDSGGNGLDFWHQPSQGTGYFRIKDAEGATLYTFDPDFGGFAEFEFGIGNITKIDELSNPFTISIYPNPTTEKIHLNVRGLGNTKASMSLSNSLSSIVMEKEWSAIGEDFNTEIDMNHLPSGIYFLKFNYGNRSKTEKIIKN